LQSPGRSCLGQDLSVEELICSLWQQELRQSHLSRCQHGSGAAVMHDEIDQREHCRLSHEPLDMYVVRHIAKGGRLPFRTDSHQDVYAEWRDLSNRPAEYVDSAERHGAKSELDPR